MDHQWTFNTQAAVAVTVFIKNKADAKTKKITLTRAGAMFNELKAKIGARLKCDPTSITSLNFAGTDVAIEDDSDVLQLEEGETIEVTATKTEQQSTTTSTPIEVDEDDSVPDLE